MADAQRVGEMLPLAVRDDVTVAVAQRLGDGDIEVLAVTQGDADCVGERLDVAQRVGTPERLGVRLPDADTLEQTLTETV